DSQADGVDAEPAGGPGFLEADIGHQGQRPGAALLAEGAGALVQEVAEGFVEVVVQQRANAPGPGGLRLQTSDAFAVEGVDGIAYRGGGAAEVAGDQDRRLTGSAGQEDLTAA